MEVEEVVGDTTSSMEKLYGKYSRVENRGSEYRKDLEPKMTFVNRTTNVVEFFEYSLRNMLLLDKYEESGYSEVLGQSYSTLVIGQMFGSGKTRFGSKTDGVFHQGMKTEVESAVFHLMKTEFNNNRETFKKYYNKILKIVGEYKQKAWYLGRYNYIKYDTAFKSNRESVTLNWVEEKLFQHLKLETVEELGKLYKCCQLSKGDCIFFHVDVIDMEVNDEKLRDLKDYFGEVAQGFMKIKNVYCLVLFSGRSSSILATGYETNPSKVGTHRLFLQHFKVADIVKIFKQQFGNGYSEKMIEGLANVCWSATSGIPRYVEYFVKFVKLEKLQNDYFSTYNRKDLEELFYKEQRYFQFRDSMIQEGISEKEYGLFSFLFYSSKFGVDFREEEEIHGYRLLYLLNCYPLFTVKDPKTKRVKIIYPKILERTMLERYSGNLLFHYFSWLPDDYSKCFLDVGKLFEMMINIGFLLHSRFSIDGTDGSSWGKAFDFFRDSLFGNSCSVIKEVKLLPKVTVKGKKLEDLGYIKKVDTVKTIVPGRFPALVDDLIASFGSNLFCVFRELSGSVDAMFIPSPSVLLQIQYKNTCLEYSTVINELEKVIAVAGKRSLVIFFALELGDSVRPFLEKKSHLVIKEGVYVEHGRSLYDVEYLAGGNEYYVKEKFGKCEGIDDFFHGFFDFLDENYESHEKNSLGRVVTLFFTKGYSLGKKGGKKKKKKKKCTNTKVLIVPKGHEILILNEKCIKDFIGEENYQAVKDQKTDMEKDKLQKD